MCTCTDFYTLNISTFNLVVIQSCMSRIKAVIDNKVGKITKKEIMEFCPDISKITVERTLTNLVKSGYIAKVGAGPSTGYVRI